MEEKTKRKTRPLNTRQLAFAKGVAQGKTMSRAARDAGYSEVLAKNPRTKLLKGQALREYFAKMLPTEQEIAQRFHEGLSAEQTIYFQNKGKVTDSRTVVDYAERRHYARLCANYRGLPELQQVAITGSDGDAVRWQIEVIGGAKPVMPSIAADALPSEDQDG